MVIDRWLDILLSKYGSQTAFMNNQSTEQCKCFSDFVADIRRAAEMIAGRGIHGAHIALIGENSYEWIVAYLAVSISGNVIVPIDRSYLEIAFTAYCE